MSEPLVLFEKLEPKIVLLTFNRPNKLNALSTGLIAELASHLKTIEADPEVRVVIMTGAGERAFMAGGDIKDYNSYDFQGFVHHQFVARELYDSIERFPLPVIAAVRGYAMGGGFELALCCDIIIAAEDAIFGLPEGTLGLSPGGGGTQRLTRACGRYVAADLLLAERRLDAQRAYQLGLVAEVTTPEALIPKCVEKAHAIIKVAPLAVREMKRLIRQGEDAALPTALSFEQEVLFRLYNTEDAKEGVRAFVEKRPPNFTGR
ncbi:MAG: enoyl-CoA hydratase-related protein [Aggregatilineales bacterium]